MGPKILSNQNFHGRIFRAANCETLHKASFLPFNLFSNDLMTIFQVFAHFFLAAIYCRASSIITLGIDSQVRNIGGQISGTGCSLNIVFFSENFKIFRTLAFLCYPSVAVCVHTPRR